MEDLIYSAPPPAYSEQSYDRKFTTAQEISQITQRSKARTSDDGEWEEYHEAAFDAAVWAAASYTAAPTGFPNDRSHNLSIVSSTATTVSSDASTSRTPVSNPKHSSSEYSPLAFPIKPLNIHKKSYSVSHDVLSQTRPSETAIGFSHNPPRVPGVNSSSSFNVSSYIPPYESTVPYFDDSRHPSPLASPVKPHTTFSSAAHPMHFNGELNQNHPFTQQRPSRRAGQPLPSPPMARNSQQPLPTHKHTQSSSSLKFNPVMTYSKDAGNSDTNAATPGPQVYNASAFYNSAVSAHISSGPYNSPRQQRSRAGIPSPSQQGFSARHDQQDFKWTSHHSPSPDNFGARPRW